ncbi:MAG: ferredoxin:thioredoxin reductase [Candidatus Aenigmarchaeota archaeon]|nr:ferredoxin:thioredoxin reductase [Candidatus Aenigmarchaeota archaeon]
MDGKVEKMVEWYKGYAKRSGFRLNPDMKIVEAICLGLLANEQKHGARYCPCRMVTGDKEEDKKIVCPCVYHKDEIKKMGHCHCRLFVRS